jgi:hypothetical protein
MDIEPFANLHKVVRACVGVVYSFANLRSYKTTKAVSMIACGFFYLSLRSGVQKNQIYFCFFKETFMS